MTNEKLEATILIEDGDIEIEMKGLWTRSMLDRAFATVLRKLPEHLRSMTRPSIEGSETQTMKEKSNERRTSKK